jgi:hypothetical protein
MPTSHTATGKDSTQHYKSSFKKSPCSQAPWLAPVILATWGQKSGGSASRPPGPHLHQQLGAVVHSCHAKLSGG